ncbi:cyclopropyl isomerase [Perilla frutescens var. frutescens]|nr:cyclopropyl isomerase [Perilla frutescens var. frutescens]
MRHLRRRSQRQRFLPRSSSQRLSASSAANQVTGRWRVLTRRRREGFLVKRQLSEDEITVYMGNATRVAVVAVGDVVLLITYILNLVPSKSVPATPTELWTGRKPSLNHIRIWGSPAHVLDKEADKLAPRTNVRLFIGYPRGTKGGLFYSPKDQKIIVSTNARFLEEDYVINHKPMSHIILEELRGGSNPTPVVQEEEPPNTAQRVTEVQKLPRRSGRVNFTEWKYLFLGLVSALSAFIIPMIFVGKVDSSLCWKDRYSVKVPHTTFLLTHVCFLFYHVASNMTLRRVQHSIAHLPEKTQWLFKAGWILALSYFIAYLETLAISIVSKGLGSYDYEC